MDDQLLGSTQPVLSISLAPGESIVGQPGEFAWMTDSIQMTASPLPAQAVGSRPIALSIYTAKGAAGTVAFASRLPGSILAIEVTPGHEYLVHCCAFLAGTPGIEVTTGFRQPPRVTANDAGEFVLRRIAGRGRAWVELSGDVVRRDLAAGTSLRTHPWHIGMCDASATVQMAELQGSPATSVGNDPYRFAVLSGPGSVWLQSMQPLASLARLAASAAAAIPAAEGPAGQAASHRDTQQSPVNPRSRYSR
ncbi:MAG: AIM24 family protein [Streptosporangiaceae bacterium]